MNKKLFGTLLLGSLLLGGTFVSCKDYDDDIDNLQSQVDALKSSAALKTDVDGLKSSLEGAISAAQNAATAAKSAADAADKKASEATSELAKKAAQADLEAAQAKLAAAEDKLAKLEAAIAELNGLEAKLTEATAAEFEALKKELNGEFADIKASVEAMLESFNIHSLSLAVKDNNIIANGDMLHWGVATKDIEWAGPKGNISKGDLLIGLIQKTKGLTVVPATVDLEGANIELVNSVGETAPVSITATPASKSSAGVITGSTRAADVQGLWNLAVEPSGVDATTIANAYASEDGKKNVAYAISVDGRVLTGYVYEVDVEKAACTHTCTAKDALESLKLVETEKMNAGTANVYQVTNSLVYDSYLTFDGNDAERAEDLGITVEGMTVVIPEGLTSRFDLYATLHVIDLKGNISKSRGKLEQVDYDEDTDIVAAVTIKPSIVNGVKIPLGTVLKNLSDTDAKQVKSIVVSTKKAFIYGDPSTNVVPTAAVGYLNSYDQPVTGSGATTSAFDVRTVRTLTINSSIINSAAGVGADTLKVDLKGNDDDIIKTVYVPIEVVKPTGAELAAEIKVASAWNGDKLKLTYDNAQILATQIFAENGALKEFRISYTDIDDDEHVVVNGFDVQNNGLGSTRLGTVDSTAPDTLGIANAKTAGNLTKIYGKVTSTSTSYEWKVKTGTATFKLANVAAWTFTYNFDIEMVDAYAGYSLKWYKKTADGPVEAAKGEISKSDGIVHAYIAGTHDGIAWKYNNAFNKEYGTGNPLTGLTDPNAQITVEMDNSANTINVANGTQSGTKWTTNHPSYTFGTPVGGTVITTQETKADITFKIKNNFGVVRSFNMTFDFID